MILDRGNLKAIGSQLGFPMVLKMPDSSFSRGVFKVSDEAELKARASKLLEDSDLILAQEYVPTQFDWRVGVLNREPLYVCQYFMPKNHWQIVKHEPNGKIREGTFKTHSIEQAPREVTELGCRAASLIGDGLYGVDIKQTDGGFVSSRSTTTRTSTSGSRTRCSRTICTGACWAISCAGSRPGASRACAKLGQGLHPRRRRFGQRRLGCWACSAAWDRPPRSI